MVTADASVTGLAGEAAVVTAELALAAEPGALEGAADPAVFVVQACERARDWLREAAANGGIEEIAELRSQAEAVRVYAMQKQLGRDAQLSATEIVRRAERGIGMAIRRGQQCGEIRCKGQGGGQPPGAERPRADKTRSSPEAFASPAELSGNGAGIYHMTDDVPGEDFEQALAQARAEGNLSRANLVRKIRQLRSGRGQDPGPGSAPGPGPGVAGQVAALAAAGLGAGQIAARLGIAPYRVRLAAREHGISLPGEPPAGRHDSDRIVRETVHALEGLVMGIQLADIAALDRAEAAAWAESMTASLRALRRFTRQMEEAFR